MDKKSENGKKAQRGIRKTRYEREGRSKSTTVFSGQVGSEKQKH
jgi:hypothetical protein